MLGREQDCNRCRIARPTTLACDATCGNPGGRQSVNSAAMTPSCSAPELGQRGLQAAQRRRHRVHRRAHRPRRVAPVAGGNAGAGAAARVQGARVLAVAAARPVALAPAPVPGPVPAAAALWRPGAGVIRRRHDARERGVENV